MARYNDPENCREPFWVSWDWLMSYERARNAYDEFTKKGGSPGTIYSPKAKEKLGEIIRKRTPLPSDGAVVEFDFTSAKDWQSWEETYFTLTAIPGFETTTEDEESVPDGLMAALSSCTLRALAAGHIESLIGGGWRVTVNRVAVFLHDPFNFEGMNTPYGLGWWSCKKLDGAKRYPPDETYAKLYNASFRLYREEHGMGGDFLVLSLPHDVENFEKMVYDI